MTNCSLSEILVELHIPDFGLALDFYGRLGFSRAWHDHNYMVLEKEKQVLCFYGGSPDVAKHSYFGAFPCTTKRGYGVEIVLFDDDVKALFERVHSSVNVVSPLTFRHWGVWDFRLEDPFGYYIRVSERYEALRGN